MTQTDSLSRKIAGRIGAECVHPSDTFAMGAAAEIIAAELVERERQIRADAIEECAKIADGFPTYPVSIGNEIRRSLSRKQEAQPK